jgi:hypothetical protein
MPVPGKPWRQQVKILLKKEKSGYVRPFGGLPRIDRRHPPGPLAAPERAAVQAWFI